MTHTAAPGAPAAEAVPTAPDWSAIPDQVTCPLCDYDLRGLAEPRCPECGYRFEWPDLLEADRRTHPYLFEDQQRRLVRAFFATLIGGLRPRRFWASLKPSHPPRLGRLIVYWALTTALLVVGWCVFDHPWATAAASQVILLLLTAVIVLNWGFVWR